jgi:ABC-2 type transport system permease protein
MAGHHEAPHVSTLALRMAKYSAVGRITVRNNLAYFYDFLLRGLFLLVILYVFVQLWSVTYEGEGARQIAGYSFEQIIWYLIFAETIILGSPNLMSKIEEEVTKGDIGYQLTRPMSYLWFHYSSYMGEVWVRVLANLMIGGALGLTLFGIPDHGMGWIGFLVVMIGSFTVNFLMTMMLALCAFWVEETRGIQFIYNKMLFTIGGMMMPLEVFPDYLQQICHWLPFQAVVYFSAKAAVHFDWAMVGQMLLIQAAWIAVLSFLLGQVYRKGVKKLNVNGG